MHAADRRSSRIELSRTGPPGKKHQSTLHTHGQRERMCALRNGRGRRPGDGDCDGNGRPKRPRNARPVSPNRRRPPQLQLLSWPTNVHASGHDLSPPVGPARPGSRGPPPVSSQCHSMQKSHSMFNVASNGPPTKLPINGISKSISTKTGLCCERKRFSSGFGVQVLVVSWISKLLQGQRPPPAAS